MERLGPDPNGTNTWAVDTDRLRIEVPEPDDASGLFELVGGEQRRAICMNLLWDGPDDQGEVEEWIEKCRTHPFDEFGLHWVIRDRTGDIGGVPDMPLGAIGIFGDRSPGLGDVGYWLGTPFWGQGLMSEALAAIVDLAFESLDLVRLEADVFTRNERGRRLVESVGFQQEGLRRQAVLKYDEWIDEALYSLLLEDTEKRGQKAGPRREVENG